MDIYAHFVLWPGKYYNSTTSVFSATQTTRETYVHNYLAHLTYIYHAWPACPGYIYNHARLWKYHLRPDRPEADCQPLYHIIPKANNSSTLKNHAALWVYIRCVWGACTCIRTWQMILCTVCAAAYIAVYVHTRNIILPPPLSPLSPPLPPLMKKNYTNV
jgi:hypothetical protein